jgi:hypothetical protein
MRPEKIGSTGPREDEMRASRRYIWIPQRQLPSITLISAVSLSVFLFFYLRPLRLHLSSFFYKLLHFLTPHSTIIRTRHYPNYYHHRYHSSPINMAVPTTEAEIAAVFADKAVSGIFILARSGFG